MELQITNLNSEEILSHPLALLTGFVTDASSDDEEITVRVCNYDCDKTSWPVVKGHFKVLVKLVLGSNTIMLQCGSVSKQIKLYYVPTKCERFVRLLYVLGADGYGRFQSPKGELNTPESAFLRISLGAQMIQTFVAEQMNRLKLGRKTFNLENNDNGNPKCHLFRLSVSTKTAESLSEKDLWTLVAREIMSSSLGDARCKYLAFLSFTKYSNPNIIKPSNHKEVVKLTKGHVSLGGGGLALLGTGCLHTWAQQVDEIPQRFTDSRVIDHRYLMDHSNYRGYYWACYATTLGAACHELGHTFNLGHNSQGIMGRGFNDFHREFIEVGCLKRECCLYKNKLKSNTASEHRYLKSNLRKSIKVPQILNTSQSQRLHQVNLNKKETLPWKSHKEIERKTDCPCRDSSCCCYLTHLASSKAFLDKSSALLLSFHKWINPCCEDRGGNIELNGNLVTSSNPIRVVEVRDRNGSFVQCCSYLEECSMEIDLGKVGIKRIKDTERYTIVVVDDFGCTATFTVSADDLQLV